jgi:hypothetical protein
MTVAEDKSPQPVRLTLWQRVTGSIITSFLIAFILTTFLALAGTLLLRYRDSLADVERQESRLANLLAQSLDAHVRQHADLAQALATAISLDERIQGAFSNRDRESLLQISQTYWRELRLSYPLAQFHFHVPPSTSFLRVHQPDKYGDSLADRPMVVEAITNRKPLAGVEGGATGVSIRGIAPVFYLDRFIGTVEIGIAFNDQLLRDLNISDKEVPYRIRILAVDLARLRAGDPNSLTPLCGKRVLSTRHSPGPVPNGDGKRRPPTYLCHGGRTPILRLPVPREGLRRPGCRRSGNLDGPHRPGGTPPTLPDLRYHFARSPAGGRQSPCLAHVGNAHPPAVEKAG